MMDSGRVQQISTTLIDPGPNHRTVFDEKKLMELADSIQENGLAQPITIRPLPNGRYEIVAGERRFRAFGLLQCKHIPALVRPLSDEEANAVMLVENTGREDLNPMDEARAYARTINEFDWTLTRTAKTAGVSPSKVKNRLKLLKLRPDIQKLVEDAQITVGLAEEMAELDHNRQLIALRWLLEQPGTPTRRVFAKLAGQLYAEQQQEVMFDMSAFTLQAQVAEALSESGGHLRGVLPRQEGLPDLPNKNGGMGAVIDEYATALLESGHKREAAVILDFWAKLMESNYAVLPPLESKVLAQFSKEIV